MIKDLTKVPSAVAYYLVQFEDDFYASDDFERKQRACLNAVSRCENYLGYQTIATKRLRRNFIDCMNNNTLNNLYYNIIKKAKNYIDK